MAGDGDRRHRADRRAFRRSGEERLVEVFRLGEHARREPVPAMRHQRIGEGLLALVGDRVGIDRRTQQAEPEHIAARAVAVFAVVEHRDAEARLRKIDEAVARNLELRRVPRGVAVGRAADDAEGAFERRVIGADRDRRQGAEQDAAVMPVDMRLDVEARRIGPERVGLRHHGVAEALHHLDRCPVRAALDDRDALDLGQFLAVRRVVVLDVPGVPVARLVHGISDELVAAAGQRLAAGALVDEAGDRAVLADDRPDMGVLEPVLRNGEAGGRRQIGLADDGDAERRDGRGRGDRTLGALEADGARAERRIDDRDRILRLALRQLGDERGERLLLAGDAGVAGRGQLVLGVDIDLADTRARQDVVELVLEHRVPMRLEALGLFGAEQHAERGDRLGGDERALRLAMLLLGAALRRQRRAVQLEIDLAEPDRQVGRNALVSPGEEILDPRRRQRRNGREIGELGLALQHLGRDAAAAVAMADREQALVMQRLAAEVLPGADDRLRLGRTVVAVHRIVEGVGKHAAAVEAFPPEEVVGEAVGLGPVHLDREERVDARLTQQLRQRAREAEAVRQPADAVARAELRLEIALPVEELAHEALAGRHVGVGLDPHRADGFPLAALHCFLDGLEEIGVVALDLVVIGGRRLVEDEARELLHQLQRGVEGAARLAAGLVIGPQPGEIDMRMAGDGELALLRIAGFQRLELLAQRLKGGDDAGALVLAERIRIGFQLRHFPDAALAGLRRGARDIVGRRGRPVERGEGLLGRLDEMRDDFVVAEIGRGLEHLRQKEVQLVHRLVDQRHMRLGETRLAHRLAEGQARDGVDVDREALAGDRKFLMVRIEAEALRRAAPGGERDEALAADIQHQAGIVDVPVIGNDGGRGHLADAVAARPEAAERDRLAVEGPAFDRGRLALAPERQFLDAHMDAIQPLLEGEGHRNSLS